MEQFAAQVSPMVALIASIIALALLIAGLGVLAVLVKKRALFQVQNEGMDTALLALKAANERMDGMQVEIDDLKAKLEEAHEQIADLRSEIESTEREKVAIIEAVAASNICMRAHDCDERMTPTV